MSAAAKTPSNGASTDVESPERKNKGKRSVTSPDVSMKEDEEDEDGDEDEDEDGMDEDEDEDDEEVEEDFEEIDPTAIRSRRTRGVKVDYTSKEALEKAGLEPEGLEEEME